MTAPTGYVRDRLLLIDLDDTLLDRGACFLAWAKAFIARVGGLREDVEWLVCADGRGFVPRLDLFGQVRERFGLVETAEELVEAYYSDYPGRVMPPPQEAVAELRRLRASGWSIGVVTNGAPAQTVKIATAGIDGLIDACCISVVEGIRKPDPAIFRLAAERCGCTLEGAWMIGDDPDADIGGAHALGLNSVWLTRGRPWTHADFVPTISADSLGEALRAIKQGLA